jgi:hypothetical protein
VWVCGTLDRFYPVSDGAFLCSAVTRRVGVAAIQVAVVEMLCKLPSFCSS